MKQKVDLRFTDDHLVVIGVGGGGVNVVEEINETCPFFNDYMVCDTDKESLGRSTIQTKVLLGESLLSGQTTNGDANIGKLAATESINYIEKSTPNKTVIAILITCLGEGTGTGAAPVIAKSYKSKGVLTIGIVTTPYVLESENDKKRVKKGLNDMHESCDMLIVLKNDPNHPTIEQKKITSEFFGITN